MSSRRKEKDTKRAMAESVKTVKTFEERLQAIEKFLGESYGVDPAALNVQFLLGELRQASAGIAQLSNRAGVLENFIIEGNLKEQFEKWQEGKAKAAEEAMAKQREAMMEQAKKKRAEELAAQ